MVYYNPYKQIWKAFIRAIRVFISSLFSKRLLFIIIVALVIMLLHLNVHAATNLPTPQDEVSTAILERQKYYQDSFILTIIPEYVNNTQEWETIIKPIIDNIIDNKYSIYMERLYLQ